MSFPYVVWLIFSFLWDLPTPKVRADLTLTSSYEMGSVGKGLSREGEIVAFLWDLPGYVSSDSPNNSLWEIWYDFKNPKMWFVNALYNSIVLSPNLVKFNLFIKRYLGCIFFVRDLCDFKNPKMWFLKALYNSIIPSSNLIKFNLFIRDLRWIFFVRDLVWFQKSKYVILEDIVQ